MKHSDSGWLVSKRAARAVCRATVWPLFVPPPPAPRLAHEAKPDVREVFSQRSKLFQRRDEWEEIGLGTAVLLESPS